MSDYVRREDGTLHPSPELIVEGARRYIQKLGLGYESEGIAILRSTPLVDLIQTGKTVWVTYVPSTKRNMPTPTFCFDSHLKTALIHICVKSAGEETPSVIVRDPLMLMNDLFNDEEARKLMNCDVLVVLAPDFPYYSAAQQHIGSLLRTRQGLRKCSLFVKPSTYELLKRPEKAVDKEFVDFMSDDKRVLPLTLNEDDLPGLIKKLNGKDLTRKKAKKGQEGSDV